MGNSRKVLILLTILAFLFSSDSQASHLPTETRFENLHTLIEKITKIEFYVHSRYVDPGIPIYEVARASITSSSPSSFGSTIVIDEPLKVGPDPNSLEIGRLQGSASFADFERRSVCANWNVVFTTGLYEGSTLAIAGVNALWKPIRELSIVGGTGEFRLARGVVRTSTVYQGTENGIFKFVLYVLTPDYETKKSLSE